MVQGLRVYNSRAQGSGFMVFLGLRLKGLKLCD